MGDPRPKSYAEELVNLGKALVDPTPKPIEWTQERPSAVGMYLRVNAGHQISRHDVQERDGELCIYWGWGGEERLCALSKLGRKLDGWWWYGPIPKAPEAAYE